MIPFHLMGLAGPTRDMRLPSIQGHTGFNGGIIIG
jgi:hypothetical protein